MVHFLHLLLSSLVGPKKVSVVPEQRGDESKELRLINILGLTSSANDPTRMAGRSTDDESVFTILRMQSASTLQRRRNK